MPTDPWIAFDRLVMGGHVKLKPAEIKAIKEKFAEEKLLSASGFAFAAAQLAAGNIDRFQVGDIIPIVTETGIDIDFVVIGKNQDGENTLTVQTKNAFGKIRFSGATADHPYGWNHPLHNTMRKYLNEDFAKLISKVNLDCLQLSKKLTRTSDEDGGEMVTTEDLFFCLSASEAGFEVDDKYVYCEGAPYRFYADNLDVLRTKSDFEKPRTWWLRSPGPSVAFLVRYVNTDGSLNYFAANSSSHAVAPACVIKAKPIL